MTKVMQESQATRRALLGAAVAAPVAVASIAAAGVFSGGLAEDALNLFDFIPKERHAAISARVIDNSPANGRALARAIQAAIDAAAVQRRRLIVPAGLYNIAPVDSFAAEPGPCHRCFAIRSHMGIVAESDATFRIVDQVSTDANVVFMCMFGTNEQLVDLTWNGLVMDMNGPRNPISPDRAAGRYSLLNQAQIFVSGTPNGQAACASNVTVDHCRFTNTPGTSCLVLAQSNAAGGRLGSNWTISNCEFIDGGLDTPDHSAVFAWAENVTCRDCHFSNATAKTNVGGNVAYEVHGSNQSFMNNDVNNYYQGVWIDGNKSRETFSKIVVKNNVFAEIGAFGVMFYGIDCKLSEVSISDNSMTFSNSKYLGVDIKIAIGCLSPLGQREIQISNNTVRSSTADTATSGVTIQAPQLGGEIHDEVDVVGNQFEETTFGVQILTNATCGLGAITVRSNMSTNLSKAGKFLMPQGVGIDFNGSASSIRSLLLEDNRCVDDRGADAQCAFGIRVQGKIDILKTGRNSAAGMRAAAYAEGALAVNRRELAA